MFVYLQEVKAWTQQKKTLEKYEEEVRTKTEEINAERVRLEVSHANSRLVSVFKFSNVVARKRQVDCHTSTTREGKAAVRQGAKVPSTWDSTETQRERRMPAHPSNTLDVHL